jgi:hypothetical protein
MCDALAPKRRTDDAGVRLRFRCAHTLRRLRVAPRCAAARAPPLTRARARTRTQIGGTQRYPWQEKVWEKSFDAALSRIGAGVPGDTSSSGGDDSSSSDSGEDDAPGGGAAEEAQARARARGLAAQRSHEHVQLCARALR